MRAHTITTEARAGARAFTRRTIAPRGILALSLAVVLLGATASTASTTPTTPAPPLTLNLWVQNKVESPDNWYGLTDPGPIVLKKKLRLRAKTSNDSTLAAGGDVKRTKKQLAAGEPTKFTAKLKQSKWKQLTEKAQKRHGRGKLPAKLKVKATDGFGQTVAEEFKLKFVCNPLERGEHGKSLCEPPRNR